MASYDNLLAEQPWSFRPSFPDTWIADLFTMENETLSKAMQASISGCAAASPHGGAISSGMLQPVYSKADATPVHTPTVSGVSENEALVSKQRRRGCGVPPIGGGRVAKRKSRPSKRAAATTFYAADPENFMRMVQQVTGMRIGGATERLACAAAVSRPEPRRAADGFPTLDTSAAFMLGSSASSLVSTSYAAAAGDGGAAEHYFDSLCSFPTLESWEAV
ncbi:calmodulin-binding protein 25-like [Salvia miltiorrhiza]|uniref:calmodulin-binding protein 25-like n=1 Tax=Salvia miltiorrhiza TaxID=226208 RepID=UPI0025AC18F2|nr:calmodulin-binding protein 25-like [Salvia miltiorrhiza]